MSTRPHNQPTPNRQPGNGAEPEFSFGNPETPIPPEDMGRIDVTIDAYTGVASRVPSSPTEAVPEWQVSQRLEMANQLLADRDEQHRLRMMPWYKSIGGRAIRFFNRAHSHGQQGPPTREAQAQQPEKTVAELTEELKEQTAIFTNALQRGRQGNRLPDVTDLYNALIRASYAARQEILRGPEPPHKRRERSLAAQSRPNTDAGVLADAESMLQEVGAWGMSKLISTIRSAENPALVRLAMAPTILRYLEDHQMDPDPSHSEIEHHKRANPANNILNLTTDEAQSALRALAYKYNTPPQRPSNR